MFTMIHDEPRARRRRTKASETPAEKLRKESAVMRFRRGGVTGADVAEAFGISERQFWRWVADFSRTN